MEIQSLSMLGFISYLQLFTRVLAGSAGTIGVAIGFIGFTGLLENNIWSNDRLPSLIMG